MTMPLMKNQAGNNDGKSGYCCNKLVAESDLQAALDAIRRKFQTAIDDAATTTKVITNNNNDVQQPLQLLQQRLLKDCSNSVITKLQSSVVPISDEAYHIYISRYNDEMITSYPSDLIDANQVTSDANDDDECVPTMDENNKKDEDEEEFEQDELIDHAAVARVQELRNQVRNQAMQIRALRESTILQAMSIIEGQLPQWTSSSLVSASPRQQQKDVSESLLQQQKHAVDELSTSMESLQATMKETGHILPTKLRAFQATIQEIQKSLKQQHHQTCSQIEQAIYHREEQMILAETATTTNTTTTTHANDDDDDVDDDDDAMTTMELQQMLPEKRLAHMLSRHW